MLPIFEFRGVNIEFSDFIAIFNIRYAIYSNLGEW